MWVDRSQYFKKEEVSVKAVKYDLLQEYLHSHCNDHKSMATNMVYMFLVMEADKLHKNHLYGKANYLSIRGKGEQWMLPYGKDAFERAIAKLVDKGLVEINPKRANSYRIRIKEV